MKRRRFLFWIGFGLFGISEKLRADVFDDLAAAILRASEPKAKQARPEHWTSAGNNTWRWHERETWIDGRWQVTGITTPINKTTGERFAGRNGYLADELVPADVRSGKSVGSQEPPAEVLADFASHRPDTERRARHGRPPSAWLRSLHADELRIWLRTIDVPEAGVSGMTFYEHLTRDHSFDGSKVTGLDEDEQALLHAAAHYGY